MDLMSNLNTEFTFFLRSIVVLLLLLNNNNKMLIEEYTIFMYIYDEYKRFENVFSSVNDFLTNTGIRDIVEFYNKNIKDENVPKIIHYNYYKYFSNNMIEIIQSFYPNTIYVPPYRLLLCKANYEKYGLHRYGWKSVIRSFLETVYSEDCYYDDFYYEHPDFEWVSYSNYHKLTSYEEAINHYKQHHSSEERTFVSMPFMIFDDWLELSFPYYKLDVPKKIYKYPFLSFIHNPPCIDTKAVESSTFLYKNTDVFKNAEFLEVKDNLSLLIPLSHYHEQYLTHICDNNSVAIKSLYHPLQGNILHSFDLTKFLQLPTKRIFCIGWWLRKYDIFLSLQNYEKILVIKAEEGTHVENYIHNEIHEYICNDNKKNPNNTKINTFTESDISYLKSNHNTSIIYNLQHDQYDSIFKRNIVFLNVYDATANNIVLECIMHNTPLLVNPLPSIVEYLGVDYPFYFTNAADAQYKLNSIDIISKTHEYLKSMDKTRFTYDHFSKTLKQLIYDKLMSK